MPLIQILGYEDGWSIWLRKAGIENTSADYIQVDNSLTAFEIAANDMGIALARSSVAAHEIERGRLIKPFELQVPVEEAFYLLASRKKRQHVAAQTFRNWLVSKAESFTPRSVENT